MARWIALALGLTACEEEEPPRCETEGTSTCESSLIVQFRDRREGDFRIRLQDDLGMDLVIDCPDPDTGLDEVDGYFYVCGQGRVTVTTNQRFAETVRVASGSTPFVEVEPNYSRGGDRCGNPCNNAIVEI